MGAKGTVQSEDGSWLVKWEVSWGRIWYEAQDQKTGTAFDAVAMEPDGSEWSLKSLSSEEDIWARRDDPNFKSLIEALEGAWHAADAS